MNHKGDICLLNFSDKIRPLILHDSYSHYHHSSPSSPLSPFSSAHRIPPLPLCSSHSKSHHVEATHEDTNEPGIYCKSQRITIARDKNDCLTTINSHQLATLIKAREKSHDTAPMWVDVQGMEETSLKVIADLFGLHPLTLEECVVQDTLEKIVNRNNYVYMVFNDFSMHSTEKGLTSTNLNIILLPLIGVLLTIHYHPIHSIYAVLPKLEHFKEGKIPSCEFVLYVILDHMMDYCEAYVKKLDQEAEELDELVTAMTRVNYRHSSELLKRLGNTAKLTFSMLGGISNKAEIFSILLRQNMFSQNGIRYLKNVYDIVLKLQLQLALARDELQDITEQYMSKVSVELSLTSNEVGILTRKFGAINTIFLPLNLLSGIFGMNVKIIDHANAKDPSFNGFLVILFLTIAIGMVQTVIFYYLKWL